MRKISKLFGLRLLLLYILFYICSIGIYKNRSVSHSNTLIIQAEKEDNLSIKFLSILLNSNLDDKQSDSDENDEEAEKKLEFSNQILQFQLKLISKIDINKQRFCLGQNTILTHSLEIHSPPPEV